MKTTVIERGCGDSVMGMKSMIPTVPLDRLLLDKGFLKVLASSYLVFLQILDLI